MGYVLRDHTADVAVEATGASLEETFAAVANGLAAAGWDEEAPIEAPGTLGEETVDLEVRAESREALLFDYLDELIYERDVRNVLPVANRVDRLEQSESPDVMGEDADGGEGSDPSKSGDATDSAALEWSLSATATAIPLDSIDAREVKAVTYSEMRLEQVEDRWEAYVVFDV